MKDTPHFDGWGPAVHRRSNLITAADLNNVLRAVDWVHPSDEEDQEILQFAILFFLNNTPKFRKLPPHRRFERNCKS